MDLILKNIKMKIKNPKVFYLSILAIVFVILAIIIDWLFLIGAVIIMIYNQKQLMKKTKNNKKSKKK